MKRNERDPEVAVKPEAIMQEFPAEGGKMKKQLSCAAGQMAKANSISGCISALLC